VAAMKAPSQRQLRVGELIRHILAEMFMRGEVHDPALDGVSVTVSEVRVSGDLKHATVFVAPLGGRDLEKLLQALDRHKKFLRGAVGKQLTVKFTPELKFVADTSFDEARHIDELLRSPQVRADIRHTEDDDGAA